MSLTRRDLLGGIAAAAIAPRAHAKARLVYNLVPKQVTDGLWMIEGSTEYFSRENGGAIVNCALLKGETGLILVDSGPSLRYGQALASVASAMDIRGVSAVVNTHHHPDHFFGNQSFSDRPIWSLGETQVQAVNHGDAYSDNLYRLLGDWMRGTEVVPPRLVLEGGRQVIDGRSFDVLPLSGHTEADLALIDIDTGTLIAGDLAFLDRAPTTPSADIKTWLGSLTTLEQTRFSAILPGHGPFDRVGHSIDQTRSYLQWLDGTLRTAAGEGLDMIEIMNTALPEQFASMGAQPEEFHRSVAHLFPTIEREVL